MIACLSNAGALLPTPRTKPTEKPVDYQQAKSYSAIAIIGDSLMARKPADYTAD